MPSRMASNRHRSLGQQRLLIVRRDRALVGSLFWRWDVQVYAGSGVADYGVRQFDSTFGAQVTLCEWTFPVSTCAGHILLDC